VRAIFSAPIQAEPTQPPTQEVPGLSRGQSGRGVALTTHPHLAPKVRKESSYISAPPLGLCGLSQGELYLPHDCSYNTKFIILTDNYRQPLPVASFITPTRAKACCQIKRGPPYYKLHLWWKVPAYSHHWKNDCTWTIFSMGAAQCGSKCSAPSHDKFHEYCAYKIRCTWKMPLQNIFRPQHLRFACNQTSSSGIRLSSSHQQPEWDLKITAVRLASAKFTIWCPHTAFRSGLCTFPSSYRRNFYSMFHLTDILTQQIKLHDTKETCYHTGVCWGIMQIFLIDLHAFT